MPVETQKQRAKYIVGVLRGDVRPLLKHVYDLHDLLGRAQNVPPHGESDRTINPKEFVALREIENAAARLRRALENEDAIGDNETLYGFKRSDTPDDSTIQCPCGASFTWTGADSKLYSWMDEHMPHQVSAP